MWTCVQTSPVSFVAPNSSISEKSENIERFRVNECLHSQIFQAVENSIVTVDSGIVRVNVNHVAKRKGTRANSNQNQFPLDFLYTKTWQ